MATNNYYRTCLKVLTNLNKDFPKLSMGKHLSTALSDYGDVFNLTDRELADALKKYHSNLLLNIKIQEEEEEFFKEEDEDVTFSSFEEEDNW